MEGIKVKKEKEFSRWILIVALILKGEKKSLKGQCLNLIYQIF